MVSTLLRHTLALLALSTALMSPAAPSAPGFVRVENGSFVLNGHPYRFVGVNYWYAPWLGRAGATGDRARLGRELDRLAALGLTNLRLVALTEHSPLTRLRDAAQTAPGVFDEAWLEGLDYALAEMDRRGLKAVLALTNYWTWSGGFPQYVHWATGRPPPPDSASWEDRSRYMASFLTEPAAQDLYRRAVETLVLRRNRFTGRLYRDEPAIMAWQLANEPRPGAHPQTREFAAPLTAWVVASAAHLRSLGISQLVSTGSEGLWGCNGDASLLRAMHEPAGIDYVTAHLWPQNWSWYVPARAAETFPTTVDNTLAYLRDHAALARSLGKPLVFEEFGLPRDGGAFTADSPTTYRDRFLAVIAEEFRLGLAAGSAWQGLNVWSWSGEAQPPSPAGQFWREGDPYMGDNPMEEQGLYAILPTDTTTIDQLAALAAATRAATAP